MTADEILEWLLIASIVLGILLAFISTAAAGRTVADLERQSERGITGAPRIQTWVNLRASLNRAAFGVVFVIINVMLVAGTPEPWRMWTNRTLWTVLLASFVVMSVLDWLAEREQVRLGMRDMAAARAIRDALVDEATAHRAADETADSVAYRQIADEAVANLEASINQTREERGEPPLATLAPVVPEHSSPTTAHQREAADLATLRARLVASTLALGLPPREQPSEPMT
jgi:hypothetical protein